MSSVLVVASADVGAVISESRTPHQTTWKQLAQVVLVSEARRRFLCDRMKEI